MIVSYWVILYPSITQMLRGGVLVKVLHLFYFSNIKKDNMNEYIEVTKKNIDVLAKGKELRMLVGESTGYIKVTKAALFQYIELYVEDGTYSLHLQGYINNTAYFVSEFNAHPEPDQIYEDQLDLPF